MNTQAFPNLRAQVSEHNIHCLLNDKFLKGWSPPYHSLKLLFWKFSNSQQSLKMATIDICMSFIRSADLMMGYICFLSISLNKYTLLFSESLQGSKHWQLYS